MPVPDGVGGVLGGDLLMSVMRCRAPRAAATDCTAVKAVFTGPMNNDMNRRNVTSSATVR